DEKAYLRDIEKLTRQRLEVAPLPANFAAEADRIKSTRVATPVREERWAPVAGAVRLHEDRRGHRPHGRRGRYAGAVKPMGSSKRRASRG
ncbi:MAG TPA: ATP-dependent helicase, partial [Allosphingosinicella sp.]|nr:ATP-dependent helicase [Allosphingosinicella sp.]